MAPLQSSLPFAAGSVLLCKISAHRKGWDGSICRRPANWSCGAKEDFRRDYCEHNDGRCFALRTFDPAGPHLIIDDNGGSWLLEDNPRALDNQILLLWGPAFREPSGIAERRNDPHQGLLYGAYRIEKVERIDLNHTVHWRIHPFERGWSRFHQLGIPRPSYRSFQPVGGRYLGEVDEHRVVRLFDDIKQHADKPRPNWYDEADEKRFRHLHSRIEDWLEQASKTARKQGASAEPAGPGRRLYPAAAPEIRSFKQLSTLVDAVAESPGLDAGARAAAPAVEAATVADASASTERTLGTLIEESIEEELAGIWGTAVVEAIRVAALSKNLILLTGSPGVGKSSLATHLIHDPYMNRSILVPVSSTWRGREDLLGYVNPVDGVFEPTPFTSFLIAAEEAWKRGDRMTRLVIFEEFNLSQPEYWLSDILVCAEFRDDETKRTITLGGSRVRDTNGRTSVTLSPALRFVATLNTDHTTRPLSPRVLDRAALVSLPLDAEEVFRRTELELDAEQRQAIVDLDFALRSKGATFSMRTGLALRSCQDSLTAIQLDPWRAIDLVLQQQVLAKVRLLAHDPSDEAVLGKLQEWSDGFGRRLPRCASVIDGWAECLEDGQDVAQA